MMGSVTIVADENIPYIGDACSNIGKVRLTPGRAVTSASVKDADILLVRSVTKVNQSLLAGSNVKFVATATIGMDHIDREYLAAKGIGFASAAGSNANSVAEYIIAAILTMAERDGFDLEKKIIGVVGVGNVGSLVVAKCESMGMTVLKNDPPRQEAEGLSKDDFIELSEVLVNCDIVTIHVPLTVSARWATYHMVDDGFLGRLKPAALLVNTSRGAVVDEKQLAPALWSGKIQAVLDVWESEPNIDAELLAKSAIGTPHIAGYSFDGKAKGAQMVYEAACRFLGEQPCWQAELVMPAPTVPTIKVDAQGDNDQRAIFEVVKRIYDVEADDHRMRELLTLPKDSQGRHFDNLRKTYPVRREFQNTEIEFATGPSVKVKESLAGIGFRIHD